MPNKFLKVALSVLSIFYLCCLGVVWTSPHWPREWWWLANLITIAPLWILLVPLPFGILFAAALQARRALIVNGISVLLVIFGIMGFQFPSGGGKVLPAASPLILKIMTFNLGDRVDLEALRALISKERPDILVFQEFDPEHEYYLKSHLSAAQWDFADNGHVELVSRFKIKKVQNQSRRPLGGWGSVAGRFELETPVGPIYVFGVHLATPRDGVQAMIHRRWNGIPEMKRATDLQEQESLIASRWAAPAAPVLIAGDFNIIEQNPLFKSYWSAYTDTFGRQGFGPGYTKYTSWHGARIDHILCDHNWRVVRSYVGPDVGGDHRPLFAEVAYVGEYEQEPDQRAAAVDKNILLYEDFESSFGRFGLRSHAQLALDEEVKYVRGNTLRVAHKGLSDYLIAGFDLEWGIEEYPVISFAYLIAPGAPVGMRIQTQLDDWICLGGTAANQCPFAKSPHQVRLIDDGQWHEVTINAREAVQGLVKSMKFAKAFELFIPQNRHQGDLFWIDDFKIRK